MSKAPIAPGIACVLPNGEQEKVQLTESFFIVFERGSVTVDGQHHLATVMTVVGPNYNNQLGTYGTANRAELDLLAEELKRRNGDAAMH